jgi:hypothetical protein
MSSVEDDDDVDSEIQMFQNVRILRVKARDYEPKNRARGH